MSYFVISTRVETRDVTVEQFADEKEAIRAARGKACLHHIPRSNAASWGEACLIIAGGHIVKPVPIEPVISYKLERP